MLVTVHDHVTVRCLPANLPHAIDLDITPIETFEDSLTVANSQTPDNVTIQEDEGLMLATAQEPRRVVEEEVAAEGEEGEAGAEGGTEGGEESGDAGGEESASE